MDSANELVETLKRAAVNAVEAGKPVNVCFGKVESVSPLKIRVEQKMTLGEKQLVLSRNVTDFSMEVTVNMGTASALGIHAHTVHGEDASGDVIDLTTGSTNLIHEHVVHGRTRMMVHNALEVGDEVILMRQQQGQKYFVIDRIGGA